MAFLEIITGSRGLCPQIPTLGGNLIRPGLLFMLLKGCLPLQLWFSLCPVNGQFWKENFLYLR